MRERIVSSKKNPTKEESTNTIDDVDDKREKKESTKQGYSPLQKGLFMILGFYFFINIAGWFFECRLHYSHKLVSTALVIASVFGCFFSALALPWIHLPGQEKRTKNEKFSAMIIVWVFIALIPRFIWELPWLLFFEKIKDGVENGRLWSYLWSAVLLGGDARYLNGDPLIFCTEWIAVFVGIFEAYALFQFFRNGKRFTMIQMSFIMAGMIVEVTLPAVYFGMEIANNMESMSSPIEMWVKFILLNLLWCIMPLVTYFWGLKRIYNHDLSVKF